MAYTIIHLFAPFGTPYGLGSNVERGFDGMGILCVFCVYDTIGNRCFEKTSFPIIFHQIQKDSPKLK